MSPVRIRDDQILFRLSDPERRYATVHLAADLGIAGNGTGKRFRRSGRGWSLAVPRTDLDRIEYQFEVRHMDGGREWLCDPGNPDRVGGAFGDKSVAVTPGYAEPAWLEAPRVEGEWVELTVNAKAVRTELHIRVWSPGDGELPLLAVHDGPEFEVLAGLSRWAGAQIEAGTLPPFRVALLPPGDRDEWYAASPAYSRALTTQILPGIAAGVGVRGKPAGMGASLGGLAWLHAQRRHAGAVGGLHLQSSSFFVPEHDAHEARFWRYQRIVRFVQGVLRAPSNPETIPVVLTCGAEEENVHNNRKVAEALARQGYEVALHETRDLHNYVNWRDTLDPWLTRLCREVFGAAG